MTGVPARDREGKARREVRVKLEGQAGGTGRRDAAPSRSPWGPGAGRGREGLPQSLGGRGPETLISDSRREGYASAG